MTPPDLINFILDAYARRGDVIFDPFAGTGTTLVEAWYRGYQAFGIEIERPRANRAWENYERFLTHTGDGDLSRSPYRNLGSVYTGDALDILEGLLNCKRPSPTYACHEWVQRVPNLIITDCPWGRRSDRGSNKDPWKNTALNHYSGEPENSSRRQRNPLNAGNQPVAERIDTIARVLEKCYALALPGARLVVVSANHRVDNLEVPYTEMLMTRIGWAGWKLYEQAYAIGNCGGSQNANARTHGNLRPVVQRVLIWEKR